MCPLYWVLKIWFLLSIRSVIFGLKLCLSHVNVQYLGFNVKRPLFYQYSKQDIHQSRGRAKIVKEKTWKNNNSNKNIFGREMCKIHDGVWISWQKKLCWYKLYVKRSKTNHFYKYNICQAILPQVEAPFLGRILLSYNCFNCFSFFFVLMHILEIENTWVPIRPHISKAVHTFIYSLRVEISVDQT